MIHDDFKSILFFHFLEYILQQNNSKDGFQSIVWSFILRMRSQEIGGWYREGFYDSIVYSMVFLYCSVTDHGNLVFVVQIVSSCFRDFSMSVAYFYLLRFILWIDFCRVVWNMLSK